MKILRDETDVDEDEVDRKVGLEWQLICKKTPHEVGCIT